MLSQILLRARRIPNRRRESRADAGGITPGSTSPTRYSPTVRCHHRRSMPAFPIVRATVRAARPKVSRRYKRTYIRVYRRGPLRAMVPQSHRFRTNTNKTTLTPAKTTPNAIHENQLRLRRPGGAGYRSVSEKYQLRTRWAWIQPAQTACSEYNAEENGARDDCGSDGSDSVFPAQRRRCRWNCRGTVQPHLLNLDEGSSWTGTGPVTHQSNNMRSPAPNRSSIVSCSDLFAKRRRLCRQRIPHRSRLPEIRFRSYRYRPSGTFWPSCWITN